jgi:acyl carrier protein
MTLETSGPVAGGLSGEGLKALLQAVGLDAGTGAEDYALSFDELGLDSLARVEIAARIRDAHGVDVEQEITPQLTPLELEELVNRRVAAGAA